MKHDGWEHTKLGSIISRLDSGVSVNGEDRSVRDGEPGVLKVSAVTSGRFCPGENKALLQEEYARAKVTPRSGDVIVCRSNGTKELVATCARVDRDYPNLFLSDKLWRVVISTPQSTFLPWLYHVLQSEQVRETAIAHSSGSSGMRNISKSSFLNIGILRPPFDEQVSIAGILDCWTTAEDSLQQLLMLKQRLKRGFGQQLLTGKRRFGEFAKDDWHEVRLQQVTEECVGRNRNGLGNLSVMAVGLRPESWST